MHSGAALGLGTVLGSVLTLLVVRIHDPSAKGVRGREPFYANTVMQNGFCNITKEDEKPVPNPNPEFPHVIATVVNPNYGLHVMVLGRDSKIYHKHQLGLGDSANWSTWKCLTPDLTKVPCSMEPHCGGYDNNPVLAWQPINGTIVAFIRQQDDLVPHELHLTDPKDPDSWSAIRGPVCLCNFPPCKDKGQTKCGVVSECDNLGKVCDAQAPEDPAYYEYGPIFPTSELQLLSDEQTKKLTLYWRGFDGFYYASEQNEAGKAAGKWGGRNKTHEFTGPNGIIE
jgi:hypothetical protein